MSQMLRFKVFSVSFLATANLRTEQSQKHACLFYVM